MEDTRLSDLLGDMLNTLSCYWAWGGDNYDTIKSLTWNASAICEEYPTFQRYVYPNEVIPYNENDNPSLEEEDDDQDTTE